MGKYRLLLFDADDTILDFKKSEDTALEKLFNKYSIPFTDENIKTYKNINTRLWKDFEKGKIEKDDITNTRFKEFFDTLKLKGYSDSIKDEYQNLLGEGFFVIDGAEDILKKLSKSCILYCVTNGIYTTQISRFKGSGLDKYFKEIFVSEKVGHQKPKKEFFDYVEKNIDRFEKKHSLIIGDSLSSDIKGGNNAGIDTCFYNPKKLKNNTDIKPTYEIKDLKELLEIVEA